MQSRAVDSDGNARCPVCGASDFMDRLTTRAKLGVGLVGAATLGLGALPAIAVAPKRLRCRGCGATLKHGPRRKPQLAITAEPAKRVPATSRRGRHEAPKARAIAFAKVRLPKPAFLRSKDTERQGTERQGTERQGNAPQVTSPVTAPQVATAVTAPQVDSPATTIQLTTAVTAPQVCSPLASPEEPTPERVGP